MQPHPVASPSFQPRRGRPVDLAQSAILLDVDGTILDVAATPQSVVVPASLVRALSELHARTNGALALISGRLIENLDDLFRSGCLVSADKAFNCALRPLPPSRGGVPS
jgi:trehalose-6-phosphatase